MGKLIKHGVNCYRHGIKLGDCHVRVTSLDTYVIEFETKWWHVGKQLRTFSVHRPVFGLCLELLVGKRHWPNIGPTLMHQQLICYCWLKFFIVVRPRIT